jgi:hypothetical protein
MSHLKVDDSCCHLVRDTDVPQLPHSSVRHTIREVTGKTKTRENFEECLMQQIIKKKVKTSSKK